MSTRCVSWPQESPLLVMSSRNRSVCDWIYAIPSRDDMYWRRVHVGVLRVGDWACFSDSLETDLEWREFIQDRVHPEQFRPVSLRISTEPGFTDEVFPRVPHSPTPTPPLRVCDDDPMRPLILTVNGNMSRYSLSCSVSENSHSPKALVKIADVRIGLSSSFSPGRVDSGACVAVASHELSAVVLTRKWVCCRRRSVLCPPAFETQTFVRSAVDEKFYSVLEGSPNLACSCSGSRRPDLLLVGLDSPGVARLVDWRHGSTAHEFEVMQQPAGEREIPVGLRGLDFRRVKSEPEVLVSGFSSISKFLQLHSRAGLVREIPLIAKPNDCCFAGRSESFVASNRGIFRFDSRAAVNDARHRFTSTPHSSKIKYVGETGLLISMGRYRLTVWDVRNPSEKLFHVDDFSRLHSFDQVSIHEFVSVGGRHGNGVITIWRDLDGKVLQQLEDPNDPPHICVIRKDPEEKELWLDLSRSAGKSEVAQFLCELERVRFSPPDCGTLSLRIPSWMRP